MGKASRKKHLQRQSKTSSQGISQALLDICEYLFPHEKPQESDLETLISIAVIAWNMANSSEEQRKDLLKNFIESVPNMEAELQADMAKVEKDGGLAEEDISLGSVTFQILSAMVATKNKLYPNDKRLIVDYAVDGDKIKVSSIDQNQQSIPAQVAM